MKNLKRKVNVIGLPVESSDSKRAKESDVLAQYSFKHRVALSKFAKLRAYVNEGQTDGLIQEIRRALRQQTNKVKRRGKSKEKLMS